MTGRPERHVARVLLRVAVGAALALSLLPVANWIPSERSVPWYSTVATGWLVGTGWVVGGALILALASRRWNALWREGSAGRALAAFDPASSRALLVVAATAGLGYLAVAAWVFERRPLLIDEVVQVWQARVYASGRWWLPVDPTPAFRNTLNLVEYQGRWFGHFPPGWPLLLAVGEWFSAGWAVGPVVGALAVGCFGLVLRRGEAVSSVRAGALLLFAAAPFTLAMAPSHMSHGPVLMWLLAALAAWLRFLERPTTLVAAAAGLFLGMAAITRPADAAAFGVVAAVWAVAWARKSDAWPALVPLVLAMAVPLAVMGAVNLSTTGSVVRSGYEILWGPGVGLGFHAAPYGPAHTPLRGLELLSLNLFRLNTYLFEAPVPGLVAAGAALLLARRFEPVDRFLLAAAGAVLLVYFAYWHDGFFLGPRFVYSLTPMIALWTARLPRLAAERSALGGRVAAYGVALGIGGALAEGIPARLAANSVVETGMRFDVDRAAEAAGVRDAVVLVRESWGAQVLARLAALGVSKPDAERYYRNVDTCLLDQALAGIEAGPDGRPSAAVLAPLMADSARLLRSPFSPDTSERVLNGANYPRRCVARINEDRQGFTMMAPTILSRRSDLLIGRDLPGRNGEFLARKPAASVYLLTRRTGSPAPEFLRLDRDSVLGRPEPDTAGRR